MIRNINFFKDKIKNNNLTFKGQVGDIIIGEYLSIDRDGMHQYKFGGVCIAILKKANSNIQHILLRQKIANAKVDFCVNITSPLIYVIKTIGKKKLLSKSKSYKDLS